MGNNPSYQSKLKDPEYKWIPSREYWLNLKPSKRLGELAQLCWHENMYSTFYSLDRHAVNRIFNAFPWPEGTSELATNAFKSMLSPELYKENLPWCRYNLERRLKYLLFLIGQEELLLYKKELNQVSCPQFPLQAPKKSFTFDDITYINATGASLKFPDGRVIDPIPHTLKIYKSEHQLGKTVNGVQFTGFNVDSNTLTQNFKELQQYNNGVDTILVINETLAMWWVDIIEDVEWNGPIAYPVIVDDVCVKLNIVNECNFK